MPYQFLEHTADIKIYVKAPILKDLFIDAFNALMDYLTPKKGIYSGQVKRLISFSSSDLTNLLVDFLNEILTLSQIHKEIYDKINFIYFPNENDKNFLIEAEISGKVVDCFKKDVKAVTYHNVNLIQNQKGEWEVTLVLDI